MKECSSNYPDVPQLEDMDDIQVNNTVNEPVGVSFTELRRILEQREKQWEVVMRKLTQENGDLEDEVLRLQQLLGVPLKLPEPRKYDNR